MWIANPTHYAFRHNAARRRAGGSSMSRHRRKSRNNPSDIVGSISSEAKKAFTPKQFVGNLYSGSQIAGGYAAVSAVGGVLSRLGVAGLLARIPEGPARTLVGYGVKGFTVGLVGILTRAFGLGGELAANVRNGARANFGVTVLRDAAGVIPGGERIRAFLSGMGNYFQADGWPAMGDYLNVQMQPTLPAPNYGATEGIYGRTNDMYGGDGSTFN